MNRAAGFPDTAPQERRTMPEGLRGSWEDDPVWDYATSLRAEVEDMLDDVLDGDDAAYYRHPVHTALLDLLDLLEDLLPTLTNRPRVVYDLVRDEHGRPTGQAVRTELQAPNPGDSPDQTVLDV